MNRTVFLRDRSSSIRAFVALLILAAGCCPKKPVTRPAYEGPTLTLAELVSRINQNNSRLSTLWASGSFECWITDEKNQQQYFAGDLSLAYRKPIELRLAGQIPAIGRVFDLGSNPEVFWLWIPFEKIDTMWWGEYRHVNQVDSTVMPIRPDLLSEVLGVNDLNPDLVRSPTPAMRFNNEQDVYMVTFHTMLPDRMIVQKEIWYDRATLLPRMVMFYDPNGRVILRADLTEHENLGGDTSAPKVATRYDLQFAPSHTRLVLKLSELKASNKGVPNDRIFKFPGADKAGNTHKVDERAAQPSFQ
jgi:hypothetical protein